MSPLQWPTPTFASLAFLLLSLGSFSDSTSSRGHTASLLPRENVRGIHGEDDISFAGRNIQNEDEGSVESETETKVLDSREERKRPYIPLNSLTFMTANSHVSTIDWSSTDPSQIRQYIAGSKLAGIPQTSTIRPASQKITTSTLPPFPLIHKTTTKRSTPLTKNPFLLTTRRPALPTVVRNVSTTSSVLLNSRPITTFRTPTTPTTIRPTASAVVSSTASGMHTSSTTRRLTAITGRPVELTTGSIKSTTSPLITWKPSSLAIRNTSAVTSTSSIITWRPSSLANSNTYAITAEGTSDKPITSATELTTIGSTFFTQWFTNNGNSLTTGFSPTSEKIPPPPTELPPPLDSIKPPLLSTWRPTLRPIPNYVKVTTQPPTTQSMSSSTTTDLPVNKLNPNASTEHSPVLSLDNNYTTSSPAVQESHSPISGMSTALPIRNTPTPNCVNVTTEALTTQSTSTTTQVPVNQVNPSAATENSPFLSWNNIFYSTSSPVVQESYSPTVRTTTSSAPLLRITRWTSTISPQVVTSQPVQRPGNTGHMPAHQNKFNSDSMEGQGIKPIKHATPPSEQQNYETEHEPLSHWQYLDSSPQPVDSYTTRPQLVVTNNFISDDDQKLIHEAFNRFQTHFSSATDSSTTWQEDIQDTDVPQIPTIEEPGAIGLAPQQPLWSTTQLLDDNKTSSVFHDDMVWYFDSSNEYNPNVSWITNPRPQVSHNFPFTSEVTRDPITTPDPALFEIISGSSNESPEKFPSNTDQSQFMTSKPTQISTHNTSKQELFTISENGSHPTRASILRPLVSPEVQVDTHAELFKVSQPDEVPGSSLAASLPTVDSNDDYDFDYAVYEDDLSEYYAVYGYLQGVEHEEDRQSKPDKLLTFDLDKNSPSILETLTWPYTTIPTKRPLDSDSAYSRFPAVEIKNPINSHDTSETKYTSHLISSSNKENMSSVLPLEISTKESNSTTVSSSIYTYSSLIPAYPQSQSLAASIPLSLSENEYANFLTENGSTYPDYNDAYYYSYEDTPVVNDFQSSLQVDYSLQVGDSSVSRPLGSEQDNLNVNPLPHSDLPASQVDTSKLQDFHLQANNNPHNLNVYNVGFLDTSYIPKIIKTTTTTRQPPVLYAPADRESQQSHNGSPTQDLETFVALNPLKPTVADVELESVQESKDTEISFSFSTSKPSPLLQDTSHSYIHYGHVSQNANFRPSTYKLTEDNMYHLFSSPFFVKEDKSNLSVYGPIIEKIKVESKFPPHELKNLHKQNSSSHLKNNLSYNITPTNTNFLPATYPGQSPETDATSSSDSQGSLIHPNVNLSLPNSFFHNSSLNDNDTPVHAITTSHNLRPFLLQPHSSFLNPSYNFQQEPSTRNQTYVTSIKRTGLRPVTQKHGSQPPDSAPSLNNYQDKTNLSPVHSSNSDISQSSTASKKDHAITVTERHAQFTEVGSDSSSVLTVTNTTTFLPQLDDFSIKFAESGSNLGQSDGVDQHQQSSGSHFAHPSNHNNQQNHHPSVQVKIWKMVDGQLRLVEEQSVPSGMFQNSGLTNGAVVNPQDVPSDVLSMVATRMEDPSLLYSLLNYNARKRRSLPSKPEGAVSAEADLGKTELKENKSETPLHHRSTISINSAHTLSNNQPNNNVEKKTNEYPAILEKMQENRRPTGNSSTFRIKEISSIPAISPDGKNKSITHFVKTSRMNDESAHSDTPVIHLVIPNLKEQPSFNTLLQRLATQSQQTLINRESQTNNREFFPRNETAAGLAFAHDQNNQRTPPARSHPISAFGGVGNNNLPFTPSPVTFQSVPSEALLPQATKPEVLTEIKHYGGVGNRNHTNLPLNIGTSLDENNLGYLHVLSRLANQIQSSNVQNPSLQGILGDITRNSPGVQASGVVGYSAAGTLLNSGASTQGNSFSQLLQEPSFPGEHRGSVLELLPSDLPHVNPLLPPDEPLDHPVPLSGVLGSLPSSSTLHREQLRKKLATITGTNTFSGHLGNEGFLNQNNHAVQNSVLGNQGQQSTFNQLTSDSQIRHPGALASLVKPGPIDSPNLTPSLPTNAFINTNSFFLPNLQNGQTALFNQQPISPGYPQSGNQDLRLPGGSLSYPQSGNQDLRLPGGSLSSPSQQMASPASNQQTIINRADVLSIIDRLQSQGSIPNGQSILDFSQTSAASILPLQQPADLSPFDPSLPYLPYQDAPSFSDSPLISSLPGGTLNPSPATVTSSNVQGCTQSTLCSLGLASLVALGISNALALPFITPLFVGRRRRTLDFTGNFTGQGESHIENDILRELVTMAVTANPGFRDILTAAMAFHVDKAQQGKNTEDHIILNAKAKEYKQLLMSLKNDQISFLIQHALNMISGRKQPQVDYNTPT